MAVLMDMVRGGKTTKVDRYEWEMRDEPGRMRMISKTDLQVDYTYQRDANHAKALDIAREWSWMACGVITVAERRNQLFVVDGQHRVLAACKRSDIDMLPCIVFQSNGIDEEAFGYLVTQTMRKAVTTIEKLRAMIATKDPVALAIKRLVEESGRTIGKSSSASTVKCVGAMYKVAKKDTALLARVWPMIDKLCEGKPILDTVVLGLTEIERRMQPGHSISDPHWERRILAIGVDELLVAARRCAAYKTSSASFGGNYSAWADGMTDAINKGLRHRLPVRALRK